MKISQKTRSIVRKPLGKLISGDQLKGQLGKPLDKPSLLIAVGDITGKTMIDNGLAADIWVYDGKEQREAVQFNLPFPTHMASNPHGNITESLMYAINDMLKKGKGRLFVQGEEDLAALYLLAKAPLGSIILYGQPNEGIVMVKVDKKSQDKASRLLSYDAEHG